MTDKTTLFRNYLAQQADNVFINDLLDPENIQVHRKQSGISISQAGNDDSDFERFKAIVKYYTKTDNEIKDIKAKIKLLNAEKNKRQEIIQSITPTITDFMSKNEIDELNSKEGVIKYRKSMVKSPLTQKMIKEQLYEVFGTSEEMKVTLDKIFIEREKIEKESLKRIAY